MRGDVSAIRSLKRIYGLALGYEDLNGHDFRHDTLDEQREALNKKLQGHYQYYGRPTNYAW